MSSRFFGLYLLERGLISENQLREALDLQNARNLRLGEYAVQKGYLSHEQAERINREQRSVDRVFGELAIAEGLLTEQEVAELAALQAREHLRLGDTLAELGYLDLGTLARELCAFHEARDKSRGQGLDPTIVPSLLAVAVEVTQKMLLRTAGLRCVVGDAERRSDLPAGDCLNVFISLSSALRGHYALSASPHLARCIARGLLGGHGDLDDEIVVDSLKELVNMIRGYAMRFDQAGGRVDIALPRQGLPDGAADMAAVFIPLHHGEGIIEIRFFSPPRHGPT